MVATWGLLPSKRTGRAVTERGLLHLPLRREGIIAVAVTLADLPVATVDQQLALLPLRGAACRLRRFGLVEWTDDTRLLPAPRTAQPPECGTTC